MCSSDLRPRRHRRAPEGPRHRDGVPELRALPPHDGAPEPRIRTEEPQDPENRSLIAEHFELLFIIVE